MFGRGYLWIWGLALASVVLFAAGVTLMAAEHEHPSEKHAEHAGAAKKEATIQDLAKAIKDFIASDAALRGGYFLVYDPVAKKPLALTLEKVHEDRLARVSENVYFACADFKAEDGKLYDLDFFMEYAKGAFKPTEITIHKEEGKPRYNWVEEGGIWKREKVE